MCEATPAGKHEWVHKFFFHHSAIGDIVEQLLDVEEQSIKVYEDIEYYEEQLNEYNNEYYEPKIQYAVFDNWLIELCDNDLSKKQIILNETLLDFFKYLYKKRITNLNLAMRTKNKLEKAYRDKK